MRGTPLVPILGLVLGACSNAPAVTAATPVETAARACQTKVQTAEHAANAFARARDEEMKRMRFGSELAMNAYLAETDHYSAEAIEMLVLLNALGARHGFAPYSPEPVEAIEGPVVDSLLDAARACAGPLLG